MSWESLWLEVIAILILILANGFFIGPGDDVTADLGLDGNGKLLRWQ